MSSNNPILLLTADQVAALGKWVATGEHMAQAVYVEFVLASGDVLVTQGDASARIRDDGEVTQR